MTELAVLFSPEVVAAFDERVRQLIAEDRLVRDRQAARQLWLTTEQAAELLSTTPNAVRCRLQRGWLDGDAVKDGRAWLVRKSVVLDDLDRRAAR